MRPEYSKYPIVEMMLVNETQAISDAEAAKTIQDFFGWRAGSIVSALQRSIETTQAWRKGLPNVIDQIRAFAKGISEKNKIQPVLMEPMLIIPITAYFAGQKPKWDKILFDESLKGGLKYIPPQKKVVTPVFQVSAPVPEPESTNWGVWAVGAALVAALAGGAYYLHKKGKL